MVYMCGIATLPFGHIRVLPHPQSPHPPMSHPASHDWCRLGLLLFLCYKAYCVHQSCCRKFTLPLQLSVLFHPSHQPETVPLPTLSSTEHGLQNTAAALSSQKNFLVWYCWAGREPNITVNLIFLFSHTCVSEKIIKSVVCTQADYTRCIMIYVTLLLTQAFVYYSGSILQGNYAHSRWKKKKNCLQEQEC
jgi:hypothetical protein